MTLLEQRHTARDLRPAAEVVARAETLTFDGPPGLGFSGVDLRAEGGTVLALHGGPAGRRTALHLALSGRLPVQGGRLVVAGRGAAGLAEIPGVNDLTGSTPLDERIAEALAAHRLLPWARPADVRRMLALYDQLVQAADGWAGGVGPREPVGTLVPLHRKLFGLLLALAGDPALVLAGAADALPTEAERIAYWRALSWVATTRTDPRGRPVAVVATCQEPDEAIGAVPPERLRLLGLGAF